MQAHTLRTALIIVLPLLAAGAHAADCDANFSASGSFLSGKNFKTTAELPGVRPDDAFQGAYQAVAKEGFRIENADKTARVLTASDTKSSPGRNMPLNVTVEGAGSGARIVLTFALPAGALAPESAVKGGFCKIVAGAAAGQAAGGATPAQAQPPAAAAAQAPASAAAADNAGGPLCLANACLGMTLEQAAALPLVPRKKDAGPALIYNGQRGGVYGLDTKGKPVTLNIIGDVDRAWIGQYQQNVRTLCGAPPYLLAWLPASSGQPIALTFVPVLRDGKTVFVLNKMMRILPHPMSASDRQALEAQSRARYGAALVGYQEGYAIELRNKGVITAPMAVLGPTDLQLKGPTQPDINPALIEQPGCTSKVSID